MVYPNVCVIWEVDWSLINSEKHSISVCITNTRL